MARKTQWKVLVWLCNKLSLNRNTVDAAFSPEKELDKEDKRKLKARIKALKILEKKLTVELDELARAGRRKEFPIEASYLPVARRLVKKWEQTRY